MSKIICDICGSSYPESAESCPICGYSRDMDLDELTEDLLEETPRKGGRFGAKKKEIFDFDEVNSARLEEEDEDEEDEEEEEYEDEEEEEEASSRPNTFVVILLTVLIVCLLAAAGFIYVRYFLPNRNADTAVETTAAQVQDAVPETTQLTIPCETLVMGSSTVAQLNAEGQHFLLNVKAIPENTTDKIIYTSGDESIATVSEDGRITAVSEGETVIYIACGRCTQECKVVVSYVEETVAPTAAPETVPAVAATEAPVEPAAPAAPAVNPNVKLKLKREDISLGVYYYTTIELDCDLNQTDVEWSSEHPHIATVDETGKVTAVKSGTTMISAKYGDQVVSCFVRCK